MKSFKDLNLDLNLIKSLEELHFVHPTPIQEMAIPVLMEGRDLLGIAQTGTGKSASFILPILHNLLSNSYELKEKSCISLILAPTRELAAQLEEVLTSFTKYSASQITSAVIIGGVSKDNQVEKIKDGVDIIVATPGRLMDLIESKDLILDKVQSLVLDEADMMLDMGFYESVLKISSLIPQKKQAILFSATMPMEIEKLAKEFLNNPIKVEVAKQGSTLDDINQKLYFCLAENKIFLLMRLLELSKSKKVIVFCKAKYGVAEIVERLNTCSVSVGEIHSNCTQAQRNKAIEAFRAGEIRVLVATDIAARGIDVESVDLVINYDLPEDANFYVHRIGRTARAGKKGQALSLCGQKDMPLLRNIEKLIGKEVPRVLDHPFHHSFELTPKVSKRRNNRRRTNRKKN